MNEEIVSFDTALELEKAGFPQGISKGQFRYTTEGEKVLVAEVLHKLRLSRWDADKGYYSPTMALPIETKTYFAPNAKDVWENLPKYFQPNNPSSEDPEGYAAVWLEENAKSSKPKE